MGELLCFYEKVLVTIGATCPYFRYFRFACLLYVDSAVDSEALKSFSLSTFISAARNHWYPAALVFGGTALLAVLAMIFLPRTYHSGAMLFVKLGRETVSLDPTATTGSTISVLDTRDNEINSIRDMLYSCLLYTSPSPRDS